MKKFLCLTLSLILLLGNITFAFATDKEEWDEYWLEDESQSGIVMFPGSDETQRNFSWYSKTQSTPKVYVTDMTDETQTVFEGKSIKATDGDYANKVTVTGLEPGTEYEYYCVSDGYTSQTYSFATAEDDSFTAMYVTDIHVSYSDEDENSLRDQSYKFNEVLEAANGREELDLILSAGDQASLGLECEYKGLTSSPLSRNITFATTIGNHDRKGVEYKYFKNMPNEQTLNINGSYIGGDYWFVKGDTLFMVMESNNGSGIDHHAFMKKAVRANKDVKWRVVMMHHDLYSGRITHRESENELLRLVWGPMFSEFDIDLVLLGHSHYYTVSDVLYNNKIKLETDKDAKIDNAPGTVSIVSGSINRPRNDDPDELGLNDTVGWYYADQGDQVLYNIIDFSTDAIELKSYSYTTGEQFNSLTLTKDSQKGGHPKGIPPVYQSFVYFAGTVYQFFNNINVYSRLKDAGFDVSLFDTVFRLNK